MKIKIILTIFTISLISLTRVPHAHAACPTSLTTNGFDNGQTSSLTSTTCAIPTNTLYVVDNGTTENSTTNTAAFTITNSTLTIQSGSILNTGTITLGTGASVVLQGGSIALGPRWVGGETDADGYTDNLTTLYTATAAGRRRISLMKSKTSTDCNGSAYGYNNTLPSTYYVDADQDAFTVSSQAGVTGICSNQSTWDTATSTTAPGGAIGTATSFNAGTRRTAASGITDCDDAQGTVKYPHTACYWDTDGDTFTNGNASGKTCLSHSTCATSTSASVGGGVAPTIYSSVGLRDSASAITDCDDTLDTVKYPHTACYWNLDADLYTAGNTSGKTCLSAATCATSRYGSRSGESATDYGSTGYLADSATATSDCNDRLTNHNYTLSPTYYPDADLDTYTSGTGNSGTAICSSASTWTSSANISVPGTASVNTSFTAGTRRASASASADCNDTTNTIRTTDISGGTVTTSGSDKIHTFTTSGTLTVTCPASLSAQVLIVGGGGNGGTGGGTAGDAGVAGGGGGGGQAVYNGTMNVTSGAKTVTVGTATIASSFNSSTAAAGASAGQGTGGGAGMAYGGGAGGGKAGGGGGGNTSGGSAGYYNASCGTCSTGGNGGAGYTSSISGSSLVYGSGGGGGGGTQNNISQGSSPGGTAGTRAGTGGYPSGAGGAGTANSGGGGGGGGSQYSYGYAGGAGGSGIVIVRYANP